MKPRGKLPGPQSWFEYPPGVSPEAVRRRKPSRLKDAAESVRVAVLIAVETIRNLVPHVIAIARAGRKVK